MEKLIELFKKNVILVMAVIIAAIACGVAVAYTRKPSYTVSEPVDYSAVINIAGHTSTVQSDNSAMTAYMATIIDFCDSGVVVDRADYYYRNYLAGNYNSLNGYIAEVKDNYDSQNDGYKQKLGTKEAVNHGYITSDMISIYYDDIDKPYVFSVALKDGDYAVARQKLRILILAFDLEVTDYFMGFKTSIKELVDDERDISVKADVSKTQIVLISFVIGCILAAGIICLIFAFDNTVNSRQVLEKLTGSKVLAFIKEEEVTA